MNNGNGQQSSRDHNKSKCFNTAIFAATHSETKEGGWHHTQQLHILCHPTAKFAITDARSAEFF